MKHIIRKICQIGCICLLVCCMLLAFTGCSQKADPVARFVDALQRRDYAYAYNLVSLPKGQTMTQEAFIAKYQAIYEALGVQAIALLETGESTYRCVMDTEMLGSVTYEFPYTLEKGTLVWTPAMIHPEMDWGDTLVKLTLYPKRGEIFDADKNLLAYNTYADAVYAVPADLEDAAETASSLADILGTNAALLQRKIEQQSTATYPVVLYSALPGKLTESQKDAIKAVPGLAMDNSSMVPVRMYNTPKGLSHFVGYLGNIPDAQMEAYLKKGYRESDKVGIVGLEASFEEILRGTNGVQIYIRNANGMKKTTLLHTPAVNGEDLHLTIDPTLQAAADNALQTYLGASQGGVVIVMDSENGDVLASSNHPTFDLNLFGSSISQTDWDALNNENAGRPLFNRATSGLYPPGSLMKPFTGAAALESDVISPYTVFPYAIRNNKWSPTDEPWPYPPISRFSDSGTPLTLDRAMINSDNIYFAYITLQMGADTFLEYAKKFGLTESIPFDIYVASASVMNEGTDYNRKLLADSGYGQGEMLSSPLQLAAMYCAFNMNGDIPVPRLVRSTYVEDGYKYVEKQAFHSKVWKYNAIAQSSIDTMLPSMKKVVTQGTARTYLPARFNGNAAAKTGTAETGRIGNEIGWVCAFETVGDQRLLVLVMVEIQEGDSAPRRQICYDMFEAIQ